MDKEILEYSLNGAIFRNKNNISYNSMNLKHKIEQKKSETKRYLLYCSTYKIFKERQTTSFEVSSVVTHIFGKVPGRVGASEGLLIFHFLFVRVVCYLFTDVLIPGTFP